MRKRGFRSIFSLLLALMMVYSALPTAAFAEGNVEPTNQATEQPTEQVAEQSGEQPTPEQPTDQPEGGEAQQPTEEKEDAPQGEQPATPPQTYTVVYADGAENTVFEAKSFPNLTSGAPTPAFGGDPVRDGYTFLGWEPALAETVTGDVTYTAKWEAVQVEPQLTEPQPTETQPTEPQNSEQTGTDTSTQNAEGIVVMARAKNTTIVLSQPRGTYELYEARVEKGNSLGGGKVTKVDNRKGRYAVTVEITKGTTFQLPQPDEIWKGVHAGESTYVDLNNQRFQPGVTVQLTEGKQSTAVYNNLVNGEPAYSEVDLGGSGVTSLVFYITYHINNTNGGSDTQYTVRYKARANNPGGNGYIMSPENFKSYAECGFELEGYVPSATDKTWYTSSGAVQDKIYASNESKFHLYAGWTKSAPTTYNYSFTLNYDVNGGDERSKPASQPYTAEPSAEASLSHAFTISSTVPTREGYTFQGWSDTADGGVNYTAGGSYTMNATKDSPSAEATLYAVWEEITYTVTYTDGVEGETVFEDQSTSGLKKGNNTPTFNGTLTRTGYTFDGWKPEVAETVTGDATYVAQWTKKAPAKPEAPDKDTIKRLLDKKILVICKFRPTHSGRLLEWLDDSYALPAEGVVKDGDGRYTYTITVLSTAYVAKYNEGIPDHTLVAPESVDVTLTWNEETKQWEAPEGEKVPGGVKIAEFEVTCKTVTPSGPEKPTENDLANIRVTVDCTNKSVEHLNEEYCLIKDSYSGPTDPMADENGVYRCYIDVNGEKYVAEYSKAHGKHIYTYPDTPIQRIFLTATKTDNGYTWSADNKIVFQAMCENVQTFTVTYTDGVENEEVFPDQSYTVEPGKPTPAFSGTPTRKGYTFAGWKPDVAETVTENATYVAQWTKNAPAKPEGDELPKISVTVDCINTGVAHPDKTYSLLNGCYTVTEPTPGENDAYGCAIEIDGQKYVDHYSGETDIGCAHSLVTVDTQSKYVYVYLKAMETDTGYRWIIDETKGSSALVTFKAVCEIVPPAKTFTVTYTDGVDDVEVFADQITENLELGAATPPFNGTPTREGYTFAGWNPTVAETVTGNATYVAQWTRNAPAKPTENDLAGIKVFVQCTNSSATHGDKEKEYGLIGTDGYYYVGDPTFLESDGKYHCTVNVNGERYVAKYSTDTGVQHTYMAVDTVYKYASLTATWTDGGYVWSVDKDGSTVTFEARCETVPPAQTFTVTYKDGVAGKAFQDQSYTVPSGSATPAFNGTPYLAGYVFTGWTPAVAPTVTADATYIANWKLDTNNNGKPDDEEERYTVTYVDGAKGKAFASQIYTGLLSGTSTPKFNGTPVRAGYYFTGWSPKLSATVTGNVTYTATWTKAYGGLDNVPKTGDNGLTLALSALLLFSFCGAAACVTGTKKRG